MAGVAEMDISGDKKLRRALRILPNRVEKKIVKKAVRAGARRMMKQIRTNIRKVTERHTGNLRKSTIKRESSYPSGVFCITVGPEHKTAPHQHLIEFGTEERETRTGASRGRGPELPFGEPAQEEVGGECQRVIQEALLSGTLEEAAKLGR